MKELYPVGTIYKEVENDVEILFLIIGRLFRKDGKVYHYIAVPLPFGYTVNGTVITINHENIGEVVQMGINNKYEEDLKNLIHNAPEILKDNPELLKKIEDNGGENE